jgi:sporulation protein YlmC with PRC-barrel domain
MVGCGSRLLAGGRLGFPAAGMNDRDDHLKGDRMKTYAIRIRNNNGMRRVLWMTAALWVGLFGLVAAGAADTPTRESADIEAAFPSQFRADLIIDRAVLDPDGNQIGEIDDLMIDRSGRVTAVIVAVEDFRKVTVAFDQLQFESRWEYRRVRNKEGVEYRVPWRQYPVITFMGSRKELKDQPAYHYDRRYPRGSASGWGIYSYPKAGPGME